MQLPAPISEMVAQIGSKGEALAKGEAGRELANRYQTEVASECRQLIAGRYPFDPTSAVDVALADFGRVFGYGGLFDNFFRDRLAKLIDNSTKPWRWREGAGAIGGSLALLNQFQTTDRIRQIYFHPGSQTPELRFGLTAESLDATVRRLAVEVDGQLLEYRHGPLHAVPIVWPGAASGQSSVLFEEGAGAGPNHVYHGPWSLFRLLDEATVTAQSDVRYSVGLHIDGRAAGLTLEATSVRNPFARNELRGFRCGG
jgi:type VI secretion system protein ImpL